MKTKTIKIALSSKIDEWMESIKDDDLRRMVKRDAIVTGGAIASMLLNEPVNDYDIYFKTKKTTKAVAEYYVERFEIKNKKGIVCPIKVIEKDERIQIFIQSAGIASENGAESPYEYFESSPDERTESYVSDVVSGVTNVDEKHTELEDAALATGDKEYRPVFMSSNAITLSDKIQIVLRFHGEADEIHKNYDFVHCTNYWTSKDNNLTLHADALECLLTKELRYVGSKYPICSIIRLRKFISRGWTVNAGQILKMVMQASELDLSDIDVLRDQLVGVDAAYFGELIKRVKEDDPKKLNAGYLIEIINRIF